MKLTRVIAIGVIAASLGLSVVQAQSFSPMDSPAEFPPASYKGKQYVDSRGCVYIRAGIDGNVSWVPRVSRDRKVICGFVPTFDEPTAGVAAAAKLDKNVVQIQPAAQPTEKSSIFGTSKPKTTTKPAATATVAAPKSTTKATTKATVKTTSKTTVVTTTAAPKTTKKTVTPLYTTSTAAAPKTQTAAPPATSTTTVITTTPATTPRRTTAEPPRASGDLSACRSGASTYKGMKVRCGPQTELPYTPGSGNPSAPSPKMQFDRQGSLLDRGVPGQVVTAEQVHPDTRVVPRHVYEANLSTTGATQVPAGYRRVFDDGRLNEHRAEMTMAGKSRMDRIWSQTVPRELLMLVAGAPIVSTKSTVTDAYTAPSTSAPVISTRSSAAEPALRLAGTPYVQVATFTDADAAQAAARKIRRLGLPVRLGKYQREGTTHRMVLAGPFEDGAQAQAALVQAQSAGFSGAFLRK